MQNALRSEIKRLAKKALAKKIAQEKRELDLRARFTKRTGKEAGISGIIRKIAKHRHFDPHYCARNANYLAKVLWFKVCDGSYQPKPAINHLVKKPDGTRRSIMEFSIPDAALANIIFRRIRQRNLKRLSPFSYAYHPDKSVFDALLALRGYKPNGKTFAVQIDFEKYFDSIPSAYLKTFISDKENVSVTFHERFIIERFLHHDYALLKEYNNPEKIKKRRKGTPQGSSISLFLANVANHQLDQTLASSAGVFARFADDVVALCDSYTNALQIEKCFTDHCRESGLKINSKKSPGIGIIDNRTHEMRTFEGVEFLGYFLTSQGLTMPKSASLRIRRKISWLINVYLIQYLSTGFSPGRASTNPNPFDWDLLGLIYELRNFVYGGLSEAEISHFLDAGKKLRRMKGLMGFYCLLDDAEPLKCLDGWLLGAVRRAMAKRRSILRSSYSAHCPIPTNKTLATGTWLDLAAWRGPEIPESKMPSFMRGWRAARKHFFTYGLDHVEPPSYGMYSALSDVTAYS